jgi:homoserine/homoserine lactone efflux protein
VSFETWLAFLAASCLISLSPGAGVVSCMAAGMRFGFARAMWNLLGLVAGILLVMALVATGLGALLAASSLAFTLVKWLGVAYLVWLGVQQWRAPAVAVDADAAAKELGGTRRQLFIRGFLVNATNPKAIVFMLAVLPQFIDPSQPQAIQYVICGATLASTDLVFMGVYTAFAAKALRLFRKPRQIRVMNRAFGGLLITMGALLATFKRAG